jgi:serine/threonine protein phosphatase 1
MSANNNQQARLAPLGPSPHPVLGPGRLQPWLLAHGFAVGEAERACTQVSAPTRAEHLVLGAPLLALRQAALTRAVLSLSFDREVAVLGDIHGRADLLERLLAALPADMPVVVAGDIADRGPDTRSCIDMLVRRSAQGVRGNHEEWLVAWATGEGFDSAALSPLMGGRATLASYGVQGRTASEIGAERWRVPAAHRDWLEGLAFACDLAVLGHSYWVVHAGVPPGSVGEGTSRAHVVPDLATTRPASLLWPATQPEDVPALDRPVIMGHVPRARPLDTGRVIAIDTGAGTLPDGALTAVMLPSRRFLSVR